jgi:hypothetical protein
MRKCFPMPPGWPDIDFCPFWGHADASRQQMPLDEPPVWNENMKIEERLKVPSEKEENI